MDTCSDCLVKNYLDMLYDMQMQLKSRVCPKCGVHASMPKMLDVDPVKLRQYDLGFTDYRFNPQRVFIPEVEISAENVARVLAELRNMGVSGADCTFADVRKACLKRRIHAGIPQYYQKLMGRSSESK